MLWIISGVPTRLKSATQPHRQEKGDDRKKKLDARLTKSQKSTKTLGMGRGANR